jgi:hypothetical protein
VLCRAVLCRAVLCRAVLCRAVLRHGVLHRVQVWMPRGGYLMRGITRANVIRLCQQEGLPLRECDFYLTQVSV